MRVLKLDQGTDAWHKVRAERFTASESPAMMGASKYMTRDELLAQKATGTIPEVSESQQRIFDRGHAAEASAVKIAEEIIGEELYPCTCEDDTGVYLASMDGLTMAEDLGFEHKLANNDLRQATAETLAEHYKWQMDQQLFVTGAEKILFMASDGTPEDCNWFWYERDESRIEKLLQGWEQFKKDLEQYQEREPDQEFIPAAQEQLPAVSVRLDGNIAVISNLDKFGLALTKYVEGLNLEPEDDQGFADLEAAVKTLKEAENALKAAEERALSEMSDVEEMRRTVSGYHGTSRVARLAAEKAVKSHKQTLKRNIAYEAKAKIDEHIDALNKALGGNYMPAPETDINGAMKHKSKVSAWRSAVNDEVARVQIQSNLTFRKIEENLAILDQHAVEYGFLFSDKKELVTSKDRDALEAIVKMRIAEHKEKEEARIQKIRDEEKAKAERDAQEKLKAEQEQAAEVKAPQKVQAAPSVQTEVKAPALKAEVSNFAAPKVEAPANIIGSEPIKAFRPTDQEIIDVIGQHYAVSRAVVINWLEGMDLDGIIDLMAENA